MNKVRLVKWTGWLLFNSLVIIVVSHYTSENRSWQPTDNHPTKDESNTIKTILFWNGPRRSELTIFGTGHDAFVQHKCPVSDCEIVNSPHQYPGRPLESFDAILFNFNDEFWLNKRPKLHRRPHQRFIFFTQEPPPSIEPMNISGYRNYFNWTMTYRMDSDVRLLYGRIHAKASAPKLDEEIRAKIQETHLSVHRKGKKRRKTITKKTRLAAAMISHCNTDGRREDYIKQLKKYVKIDVYGWCHDEGSPQLTCDTNEILSSTPECYDMLEANYYFYLSFENSICTDYVTEKFFQIMKHDMIPVVYGGANYSRIAPKHSYIDARQFKPKDLATYLRQLANNVTLYNEYFWWKEDYIVEAGLQRMARNAFCDLCQKLHQDDRVQSYKSLASRWDPRRCHRSKFINKNSHNKNKTTNALSLSPLNMMNFLLFRRADN